ncbi:uncharacterized protein APUU_31390S [Aspergillus puulaauensis]|uniref:F-box domain-containing protein n=1 Tax=Aspergillus puulaauensis TaxID=1220207 RepID=A0A7R7XKI4_9EURO|nr:uncharacterized protein APUU_31390S [Aspergillus puulaauensis]BCS23165.1 hypothetical protein APUU_31390S [Aspergillus puulaauensis]
MASVNTTASPTTILSLPNEVLIMIFEYLLDDGLIQSSIKFSSRATDTPPGENNVLTAIARTCKRFGYLAPQYVSRRVILRRSTDVPLLLSRLRTYPELAVRVRKLVVYEYDDILAASPPGSTAESALCQVAAEKPRSDEMKDLWTAMGKSPHESPGILRTWMPLLRDPILDLLELLLLVPGLELFRFLGGWSRCTVYCPDAWMSVNPFQHALVAALYSLQNAGARFLPKLKDFHVYGQGLAAWECAVGTLMSLPQLNTLRLDPSVGQNGISRPVTPGTGVSSTLRHLIINTPKFELSNVCMMIQCIRRLETLHVVYYFPFRDITIMEGFELCLRKHRQTLKEVKLIDVAFRYPRRYRARGWSEFASMSTLRVPFYLLLNKAHKESAISDDIVSLPPRLTSLGMIPQSRESGPLDILISLSQPGRAAPGFTSLLIPKFRKLSCFSIPYLQKCFKALGVVFKEDPDAFVRM